jgi:hypothetical protein
MRQAGRTHMSENPPETVNREFFLRKVQECIRHADEAALPVTRVYWQQLADRWLTLAQEDSPPDKRPENAI